MPIVIQCSWDDVPHIADSEKERLRASVPPYQLRAREKGIPLLGSGAIYPIDEGDVLVKPFELPYHWPRGYGMDVGWKATAAIWGAWDRDSDTVYLYHEYYGKEKPPPVHAASIRAVGDYYGVCDPAARQRGQKDGERLLQTYRDLLLHLEPAEPKQVESGLLECHTRMTSSRLKVFNTLPNWLSEFRFYRRNEKGLIVKENDHLMDAMRYLVMNLMTACRRVGQFGSQQETY